MRNRSTANKQGWPDAPGRVYRNPCNRDAYNMDHGQAKTNSQPGKRCVAIVFAGTAMHYHQENGGQDDFCYKTADQGVMTWSTIFPSLAARSVGCDTVISFSLCNKVQQCCSYNTSNDLCNNIPACIFAGYFACRPQRNSDGRI